MKLPLPGAVNHYWRSHYPECEPIPFWLRGVYQDRWVRFHTLPSSKRYPDTEFEYQVILKRHNSVLDSITVNGAPLILSFVSYSETPKLRRDAKEGPKEFQQLSRNARWWRTVAKHELENEEYPNYWHLFLITQVWQPGVFDSILRLVADDAINNIMILNTQSHSIYHPYDGGADVILHTTAQRDQLKQKFRAWLSSRSDGL